VAVFDLPVPVWVTGDTLGTHAESGLGPVRFQVHTPVRASDGRVSAPPNLGLPLDHAIVTAEPWAHLFAAFTGDDSAIALCRIAITARRSDHSAKGAAAIRWGGLEYELAHRIDYWFDQLRGWIEIITGQDLDPEHRVYDAQAPGHGLHTWNPDLADFQPPGLLTMSTPHILPLPAEAWRSVLAEVEQGNEPPLEELLSRDARAAHRRGHYRRAIIDAATAADIVLNRLVENSVETLPSALQLEVEDPKKIRTFGRNITIADQAEIQLAVPVHRLRKLNDARNDAVHHGHAPSASKVAKIVQISIDLLASHGPYPR